MNRTLVKIIILFSLFGVAQSSSARDWFGKNNRGGGFGGFGGNNGGCSDWPEWTPMYWMEEMMGNNDCDSGGYYPKSTGQYGNPYQQHQQPTPYAYPYGTGTAYSANPYLANPYASRSQQNYRANPYAARAGGYPNNRSYPSKKAWENPFGGRGMSGLTGSSFSNPFSSFSGGSSPFSSFGGGSPWSSFGSPMGLGGGFPGMSPMSPFSPMGFGSPMSMGAMGIPGMNPLSGFGGSPFSSFR